MSKFSENLANLIKVKGITAGELSAVAGVEEGAVQAWCNDTAVPNLDQLIAISDALDVSVDELLGKVEYHAVSNARADFQFDDDDTDDEPECYVSEEDGKHNWRWRKKGGIINVFKLFPYSMVCVAVYLTLGFACGLWHPGWIIFLTAPLYVAITDDPPEEFPWAILVTVVYLLIGFTSGMWHPWWLLYLTVPVYHTVVALIMKKIKNKNDRR